MPCFCGEASLSRCGCAAEARWGTCRCSPRSPAKRCRTSRHPFLASSPDERFSPAIALRRLTVPPRSIPVTLPRRGRRAGPPSGPADAAAGAASASPRRTGSGAVEETELLREGPAPPCWMLPRRPDGALNRLATTLDRRIDELLLSALGPLGPPVNEPRRSRRLGPGAAPSAPSTGGALLPARSRLLKSGSAETASSPVMGQLGGVPTQVRTQPTKCQPAPREDES